MKTESTTLLDGGLRVTHTAVAAVAKKLSIGKEELLIILREQEANWQPARALKHPCRGRVCKRQKKGHGTWGWVSSMPRHDDLCYRRLQKPNKVLGRVLERINAVYLRPALLGVDQTMIHGHVPGRNVRSLATAVRDTGHNHFVRIDLADAYGQINRSRVLALFRYGLNIHTDEAKIIAHLVRCPALHTKGLPQGASTSPLIYTLVLDYLLRQKIIPALPGDMRVLVYVDDFVFCSAQPFTKGRVYGIYKALARAGLKVNRRKTRRMKLSGGVSLPGIILHRRDNGAIVLGTQRAFTDRARVIFYKAARGRLHDRIAYGYHAWLQYVYSATELRDDDDWYQVVPEHLLKPLLRWVVSPWRQRKQLEEEPEP